MSLFDLAFEDPRLRQTPQGLLPASPVGPAQMPQFPPPTFAPPPSLLDRLKSGVGGLLERASDSIRPKAPSGYEGLLTPDEIKAARPGLLQSLIGTPDAPSASQRYENNLNGIVQRKAATLELGQHAQELARRQAVIQHLRERYPNFATMTPEAQRQAVVGIFGELLANGEFDAAGKIASAIGAIQNTGQQGKNHWEDLGGRKVLVGPDGAPVPGPDGQPQYMAKSPNPRDPNAPDTYAQLRDQRMFQRASQLSDDFRQGTKQYATIADMLGTAIQAGPTALQGDPQAQQSLIFAFMKLLDPGSTVREGEYASAKNAGSIPEKIQAQYNGVLQGSLLSGSQVQRMLDQIKTQARGWRQRFEPIRQRYEATAKRWGVNPDDVVYDYFQTLGAAIPPSVAPTPRPGGRVNPLLSGGK